MTTAQNAVLALEAMDRTAFDILVIDLVMPPGTLRGAALGRMIHNRHPRIPVIFITGHPDIMEAEGELPGPIFAKPIELSGNPPRSPGP